MDKKDIYEYLTNNEIWHELTEHEAVYNMLEVSNVKLPYPEEIAKNLFVRDDKKRNYYLISVKSNKKVDLKKFKKRYNKRSLSFASDADLLTYLGLHPGAVTPFGILNDNEKRVEVFIDKDFLAIPGLIGVHPNDNTATVWLKTTDLINILKKHGNAASIVEI